MQKCKVIAIANQKGGTGKTTTMVNLGIGLANAGKRVLLVDCDPQSDLTTSLGWQGEDIPVTFWREWRFGGSGTVTGRKQRWRNILEMVWIR